jgi:hypothetical protein
MISIFKKTLALFASLVLLSLLAKAQKKWSKYEVGVNAGTFIYQGDLTPATYGSFKTPGLVLGINGSKQLTPTILLRLDLNVGRLNGNDAKYAVPAWRQQRAFAFHDKVTEITGSLVYHPLGIDTRLSPYLFGGAGFSNLNVRRDYSRFNAAFFATEGLDKKLAVDIAHALPKSIPIIPVGLGVRYGLTNKIAITTEASYRIMSTDYLDGFSVAANPDLKDHYYKYSVGLIYSFHKTALYDCPVVKP